MEDLQGGTFSRRNPKGDSEQKIGRAEEIPCSDRVEMSRLRIRREPRHGQGKDAGDDVAPAGEVRERTRKPPLGSQQQKQDCENTTRIQANH